MSDLKPEPKRIALFLDGTWNTLEDNTNVWRLKLLCNQTEEQVVYYSKGVGTGTTIEQKILCWRVLKIDQKTGFVRVEN